jgi:hypothetical protein
VRVLRYLKKNDSNKQNAKSLEINEYKDGVDMRSSGTSNRKIIGTTVIISIAVTTLLASSTGFISSAQQSTPIAPIFVAADRALGETAADETRRSCATRHLREYLTKNKAYFQNKYGSTSIDYSVLLNQLVKDYEQDIRHESGVLNRGGIPYSILKECEKLRRMVPNMAVGVVNATGLPSVLYATGDSKIHLYLNKGNGTFTDTVLNTPSTEIRSFLFTDVNADTFLDIVIPDFRTKKIITMFGNGKGEFPGVETVKQEALDSGISGDVVTAVAGDLNKDGLPEIVVAYRAVGAQAGEVVLPIRILYNTGETGQERWDERTLEALGTIDELLQSVTPRGEFADASKQMSGAFLPVIADFNNDTWMDIYVSSDATSPRLYISKKDGKTFDDRTNESGVLLGRQNTMGAAAIDYDGDGWMDIIATDVDPEITVQTAGRTRVDERLIVDDNPFDLHRGAGYGGHRLLRNNRDGTFTDIGAEIGIARAGWGYGFTLTDLNLDGYGDFLVAAGELASGRADYVWGANFQKPYLLARSRSGYTDLSLPLIRALTSTASSTIVTSADFDGDHRPDLLFTGMEHNAPYLLLNRTPGNAASIVVTGKGYGFTPTTGEGAVVTIKISGIPDQTYSLPSMLANYLSGASNIPLPIGLGSKGKATVTVKFPTGSSITRTIYAGHTYLFQEP